MKILVVDLTSKDSDALVTSVESSTNQAAELVGDIPTLSSRMSSDESATGLIVQLPIAVELARYLSSGIEAKKAISVWEENARNVTNITRLYGDRLTLVTSDGSSAVALVESVVERGALRTGLDTRSSSPAVNGYPSLGEEDPGLMLAAQVLFLESSGNSSPSSQSAKDGPGGLTSDSKQLVEMFLEHREVASQEERASALNTEASHKSRSLVLSNEAPQLSSPDDFLVEQLLQSQQRIEDLLRESRSQSEKIDKLQKGRNYRKSKIRELEEVVKERDGKLQALRRGRSARQERIKMLEIKIGELEAQSAELRDRLRDSRNEPIPINGIIQVRKYIRGLRRVFSRKSSKS